MGNSEKYHFIQDKLSEFVFSKKFFRLPDFYFQHKFYLIKENI